MAPQLRLASLPSSHPDPLKASHILGYYLFKTNNRTLLFPKENLLPLNPKRTNQALRFFLHGWNLDWQDTESVTNVLAPESYWVYFLPLDMPISHESIQVLATSCSLGLRRMMPSVQRTSLVDLECQGHQRPFRPQCNGRKSTRP